MLSLELHHTSDSKKGEKCNRCFHCRHQAISKPLCVYIGNNAGSKEDQALPMSLFSSGNNGINYWKTLTFRVGDNTMVFRSAF